MNKILKDLYSGSLFPAEKCGIDNTEIKELTRHLNIIFDKLKNCLNGNAELLDLFEKTSICLNALYQEEFLLQVSNWGSKSPRKHYTTEGSWLFQLPSVV